VNQKITCFGTSQHFLNAREVKSFIAVQKAQSAGGTAQMHSMHAIRLHLQSSSHLPFCCAHSDAWSSSGPRQHLLLAQRHSLGRVLCHVLSCGLVSPPAGNPHACLPLMAASRLRTGLHRLYVPLSHPCNRATAYKNPQSVLCSAVSHRCSSLIHLNLCC